MKNIDHDIEDKLPSEEELMLTGKLSKIEQNLGLYYIYSV